MMGGAMAPGGYGQLLTCASCHGPQARGGMHRMHMRTMTAPDIRFLALSVMPEMKRRTSPYGIGDLPDGQEVKADMPRWQMGEADLADLFAFLKALPD
jgi:mono/diheme cytochrome c family protein